MCWLDEMFEVFLKTIPQAILEMKQKTLLEPFKNHEP